MDKQQGPTARHGELYSISCDKPQWDFPGGPVVSTLRFQFRGLEFHSWVGQFHMTYGVTKKKKTKKQKTPHTHNGKRITTNK